MESGILIYDQDCPLCKAYTRWFISKNWLNKGQVQSFQAIQHAPNTLAIDWERARCEIPFTYPGTQQTYYGVDSLLHILGEHSRFFKWLATLTWLMPLWRALYAFVSYNRRVIPISWVSKDATMAPPLHKGWRFAFIGFVGLMYGAFGWMYTAVEISLNYWCISWVIIHILWGILEPAKRWDIWGNAAAAWLISWLLYTGTSFIVGDAAFLIFLISLAQQQLVRGTALKLGFFYTWVSSLLVGVLAVLLQVFF